MFTVVKKFNIPTLDLKVFDDSKTEVDDEVFDLLISSPNLGVLEICLAQNPNPEGMLFLKGHLFISVYYIFGHLEFY